jgi:cytidylate kinase
LWEQVAGERISYLNYVRAALCERAQHGHLVYHGHAGHLLLAGVSHVIRVRVVADLEYRIKSAAERRTLSRKEAIAYIKKVDQERVKWTRFLYGVDWHDPGLYDVVVNVERLGVDGACELVVRMTELDPFKPTPASQKALDDLALSSRVWAALASDPRTAASDLRVEADDGLVTVNGTTGSQEVVEAIPVVAGQISGVREVNCHLGIGTAYEPFQKPAGSRLW